MTAAIGQSSHALAALLFGLLAIWQLRRPSTGAQHHLLTGAFAITAFWALAVAIDGTGSAFARIGESARNLAWLGFTAMLLRAGRHRDGEAGKRHVAVAALYGTLAVVLGAQLALDVMPPSFAGHAAILAAFDYTSLVLRLVVAIGALVLVHNLYTAAAPDSRWGIRLPVIALASMWAYDLNLYTFAYLLHGWSGNLLALRGGAMAILAPLFALAARRNARWKMRLSRTVAFQSLSLMAIGGYLVAMVLVVRGIELVGGSLTELLQVTVVFGMSVTALTLLPSGRLRGWARVKVAKHFFQHRYDYRSEWLRFTDTLATVGTDARPLEERVIQAVADITDSPGGLLLVRSDGEGGLEPRARWNWRTAAPPADAGSAQFADELARTGWILAIDGGASRSPAPAVPEWLTAEPRAWAAVPLVHLDRLVGVVVLERPRFDRRLDWEDFDLLRVAGRQAASYLAEANGQEALSEARRFDEFNRRFAFIIHDIKNLASQIGLVARNAERHADNPDFRADMVATLNGSAAKMNVLLARLSAQDRGRAEELRPVALSAVAAAAIAPRRGAHPIDFDAAPVLALADPVRLEQALTHLVQNAVDASSGGAPVSVSVAEQDGAARIAIADRGAGMTAEFVRSRLFKPFVSTKAGGFGIGAYEARALIQAMGGTLDVESRAGEGTCFTVTLPLAEPAIEPQRKRA